MVGRFFPSGSGMAHEIGSLRKKVLNPFLDFHPGSLAARVVMRVNL
jgi:hypothetical protein